MGLRDINRSSRFTRLRRISGRSAPTLANASGSRSTSSHSSCTDAGCAVTAIADHAQRIFPGDLTDAVRARASGESTPATTDCLPAVSSLRGTLVARRGRDVIRIRVLTVGDQGTSRSRIAARAHTLGRQDRSTSSVVAWVMVESGALGFDAPFRASGGVRWRCRVAVFAVSSAWESCSP